MHGYAHECRRVDSGGSMRDDTPDWLNLRVSTGDTLITWIGGAEPIGHELIDIGWQLTVGPFDVLQVDLCSTVQHRAGRSIRQ